MKRVLVMLSVIIPLGAFAQSAKEEAQAKADAAMAQGCEFAKKQILEHKDQCADEAAKIEPVNCQDKAARKAVDPMALNKACSDKQIAAVGAGKGTPKEGAPAEAKKPAGKGSHCKVLDDAGAVVAEHDSEGGSIKCMSQIREKVKGEKCEPSKKLAFKFIGEMNGKELKPTSMNITCPRK